MLDCTKQNEVTSVNERYNEAPEMASCSKVLDRSPDFPSSSKGLKREVLILLIVAG